MDGYSEKGTFVASVQLTGIASLSQRTEPLWQDKRSFLAERPCGDMYVLSSLFLWARPPTPPGPDAHDPGQAPLQVKPPPLWAGSQPLGRPHLPPSKTPLWAGLQPLDPTPPPCLGQTSHLIMDGREALTLISVLCCFQGGVRVAGEHDQRAGISGVAAQTRTRSAASRNRHVPVHPHVL